MMIRRSLLVTVILTVVALPVFGQDAVESLPETSGAMLLILLIGLGAIAAVGGLTLLRERQNKSQD